MAMLAGIVLVVMLGIWIFNENQAAKADQLQQEFYEIKADLPSNEQVDTWLGRLEALQEKAGGQAAEKNTYLEMVDLLIKQAIPAPSSTSFLSASTAEDKPAPPSEANKKKMLEKARALALDASGKAWADDGVKAWNQQVQDLVGGELNKAWLPESRLKQAPRVFASGIFSLRQGTIRRCVWRSGSACHRRARKPDWCVTRGGCAAPPNC